MSVASVTNMRYVLVSCTHKGSMVLATIKALLAVLSGMCVSACATLIGHRCMWSCGQVHLKETLETLALPMVLR